ncbi:MAG TPA: hypothetical protein VFO69_13975 [Allosphingosinicella sp.]|nr:hypothetical protein [Allosphingosinicella sp.]
MSKPPSYPEEAPVGDPVGKPDSIPPEAKAKPTPEGTRTRNIVTGAAIGIGSAALVAALLYANRSRKSSNQAVSMPEKPRNPGSAES